MQPFLDSTDALNDATELRSRAERDGHLYLRALLPIETIERLRLQILGVANEAGWVRSDAPLEEAFADLNRFCVEPNPDYMDVYARMYALPDFHAIQHHPKLIAVMESILGETVIPHPRIIGRTIFPQKEAYTTPAHQDFIPIQGTADTYTAWFPLTDLPAEMGGLQIASGSTSKRCLRIRTVIGGGWNRHHRPVRGHVGHESIRAGRRSDFPQPRRTQRRTQFIRPTPNVDGCPLLTYLRSDCARQPPPPQPAEHVGKHLFRLGRQRSHILLAELRSRGERV